MTSAELQAGLAELIAGGLTFSACVAAFAASEDDPHVLAARDAHHRDGEVEIDDRTIISESDHGAYVMAWVWVDNEQAGISEDGEPA